MNLEDRFTRGFLAGLAGGIAMNAFSAASTALDWVEVTFADWAGVFIFGRQPQGIAESTVALAGQLFFAAIVGVVFAYLVYVTTSRNYMFKGLIYGLGVWFLTYAAAILFRVPSLVQFGMDTVSSNLVGSLIYGLVLAWVLKHLDNTVNEKT